MGFESFQSLPPQEVPPEVPAKKEGSFNESPVFENGKRIGDFESDLEMEELERILDADEDLQLVFASQDKEQMASRVQRYNLEHRREWTGSPRVKKIFPVPGSELSLQVMMNLHKQIFLTFADKNGNTLEDLGLNLNAG